MLGSQWRRRFTGALVATTLIGAAAVSPAGAQLERTEGRRLRADHPDWVLPAWTADGPAVWTMVGAPYAASVSLVGGDGSFAPRNHGPSIVLWLYDLDRGQLLDPGQHSPRTSLDDDELPIVTTTWDADDLHVETTFMAGAPGAEPARWFEARGDGSEPPGVLFVRSHVSTSSSTPRHLVAVAGLRPFGVEPAMHAIGTTTCDAAGGWLAADNSLSLVGGQAADSCGTSSLGNADNSTLASRNDTPSATSTTDPAQRAEALLRTGFTATDGSPGVVEFRAPQTPLTPTDEHRASLLLDTFASQRPKVQAAWRAAIGRVSLEVPDQRLSHAFRTAQAYLLLNRRGALPRSGPLAHDAFWVRDTAYIGEALERAGLSADNQATLDALVANQRPDGSIPAITDAGGPRPVDEWDAPGQTIGALVSHYRFNRDRTWLARVYPNIAAASAFLDALRGRTLNEGPETRALLPANYSAEDLGSASWHHYWDDFWALAGYREAAYAASELDRNEQAQALAARADDLQRTILESLAQVEQRTGKPFIPNGPEDVLSSSMARGSTPALWPVVGFRGSQAGDLLVRSFASYYPAFFEPQGGGYRHFEGTLWPYGGLGVAHAMSRLGMLTEVYKILDWTLSHETLPGAHAWGEGINPDHGGLEVGDMPHSWAAAELISLARDMLLSEQDGRLLVYSAGPDAWLAPGQHVALHDAPTQFGPASISLTRLVDGPTPGLRVELDGAPPAGWSVRLPGSPSTVAVDDGSPAPAAPGPLQVGSGSHVLVVSYDAP